MSVEATIRDIAELLPTAQTACKLLFQECYKAGIRNVFITETYRSQERQNYLYAQGRTRPGAIVTWTLSSKHKSRLAWDIAVGPPNTLYDASILNKVGAIARKLNIIWGSDWAGSIDRVHFEINSTWKMPSGYKLEGNIVVPTSSTVPVQFDPKEEVPMSQIWNPGSPAMQTAAEAFIAQAVQEGIIQASHLTDLQNKQMTTDRLLGLYITIDQRRNVTK
ncbi:M15 family metallopeptidase [Metasolibacillus sp.]|uniref:M15 family metallopeptidase n=1 Tax=Metasolibacillus sp. TaxID=2703680 RepID=UPI0025F3096F|nr:M15 family metallopeptidase [Metasolibacillus sp.]MCT6925263.1 M15 family metallopeptidase [Metasolibacillus sp.]MCT6941507.1 M15 family metallopeptidase [Metasolibacillus sp.]